MDADKIKCLTKSGLELKRNCNILVPIAPLGGSSNAVKARVERTTYNDTKAKQSTHTKFTGSSIFL